MAFRTLPSPDWAKKKLESHFGRDRSSVYDRVLVLLLYWADSDHPGFESEADQLQQLFAGQFNYAVERYAIPSRDSEIELNERVAVFMKSLVRLPDSGPAPTSSLRGAATGSKASGRDVTQGERPSRPRTLGVIHYGGHGDEDVTNRPPQCLGIWAARKHGDLSQHNSLSWSRIQPSLSSIAATADILVILDCCYAAQSARGGVGERVVPANVEFVAACGKGCSSPLPLTDQSFTGGFIRELRAALLDKEKRDRLIVGEMVARLASGKAGMKETPIHYGLKGPRKIRLDPLPLPAEPDKAALTHEKQKEESIPLMTLQMRFKADISDALLNEVVDWLTTGDAPRDITMVEITELTSRIKALRGFVLGDDNDSRDGSRIDTRNTKPKAVSAASPATSSASTTSSARFEASAFRLRGLSPPSQELVARAWANFSARFASGLRILLPPPSGSGTTQANKFCQELEDNISSLQRVIEREVMSIPQSFDPEHLQEANSDALMERLGVAETIRVRLTEILRTIPHQTIVDQGMMPVPHSSETEDRPGRLVDRELSNIVIQDHPEWGRVLVEYRQVDYTDDERVREDTLDRMQRLACALEKASAKHFRTPRCLGCMVPSKDLPNISGAPHVRYGLIFGSLGGDSGEGGPHEATQGAPVSLYTILKENSSGRRVPPPPTLGQRFRLAFEVAQAVMRWHLAGWVLQGLASYNIVFARRNCGGNDGAFTVDYGEPYLFGFEYTREYDASSAPMRLVGKADGAERIHNLYRHPDRKRPVPRKKHTRQHDLYALGVLLSEIGRWMPLEKIPRLLDQEIGGETGRETDTSSKNELLGQRLEMMVNAVLGHNVGLAYRDATLACLRGDLGVVEDDPLGTRFAAEMDKQIVQRLETGLRVDG